MFGQQNAGSPPQGNTGLSFDGLGFNRPQRLPMGTGTYEIVRLGTQKDALNTEQFYVVVKCVAHDEAGNVGGVFSRQIPLTGIYVKRSLAEIGRMIMCAFGPEAVKLPDSTVAQVLNQSLLADNWKSFNETQSIEGKSLVGTKVKIRGVAGSWGTNPDGTPKEAKINPRTKKPFDAPLPNYFTDPA